MRFLIWRRPPRGWISPVPRPNKFWLKGIWCFIRQRHKPHHFIDYFGGFRTEGVRCRRCGGVGIKTRESLGFGAAPSGDLVSDQNPLAPVRASR